MNDAIIMRTTPYSVLGTHGRGRMLAFEVDELNRDYQRGWSILARGRAEVVNDQAELLHIRQVWDPRPWASGNRELYLRLPWTELTGRKLGSGWNPEAELPYRRRVVELTSTVVVARTPPTTRWPRRTCSWLTARSP